MEWSVSPTNLLSITVPYYLESCDNPSQELCEEEREQIISWIIEELEYNTDLDLDIFTTRPEVLISPETSSLTITVGIISSIDPQYVVDEILSVLATSIPVGEDRLLNARALNDEMGI